MSDVILDMTHVPPTPVATLGRYDRHASSSWCPRDRLDGLLLTLRGSSADGFVTSFLLVTMNWWFAPTKFVITFETKGLGKFSQDELEKLVERDSKGNVHLNLPTKSVLIANHQVKPAFSASFRCRLTR